MDIAKSEKQRSNALYRATQFGSVFSRFLTQMSRSALDYEDLRPIGSDNRTVNLISNSSGTILKLADKSERIVRAGDVLMEIGNIEQIEVEADVLSTVAVQLKPGMPVEMLRWGGEQLLHGTVERIEPAGFTKISALGVEEQRVKVIIAITTELTDRQRLGDGFRVEARFILWQSDRALQIPNSALFRDNNEQRGWAVYRIKSDRLEKRAVKIGHRNSLMAEVIEGLDENESVVAYLSNELKDGVKVEIR